MLRKVAVHIGGFGQVMKVGMEEDFAGSLGRIRGCSKVELRLRVNKAGKAAIV
jgi:hypothetical protein